MATGTLVDVVMPQMGVSVSEGTITRWAKNAGETVEADETIVEISTDKVDTEVPAPATGVVRELLAAEGETVPVNTRIAIIDTGGGNRRDRACQHGVRPRCCSRGAAGSRACGGRGGGTPGAACAGERERAWRRGPHVRLTRRRPHGGRAQPRHQRHQRNRRGRPCHEEGRPGVHRLRRPGRGARRASTGAGGARRAPLRAAGRARDTPAAGRSSGRRPRPRRRRPHRRSSRASPARARSSTGSTPSARSSRATCATRSRRPRRSRP